MNHDDARLLKSTFRDLQILFFKIILPNFTYNTSIKNVLVNELLVNYGLLFRDWLTNITLINIHLFQTMKQDFC